MTEDNRDYSENPPIIKPLKKNGLIIYFGKEGKVIDVRAEEDRVRLYNERE